MASAFLASIGCCRMTTRVPLDVSIGPSSGKNGHKHTLPGRRQFPQTTRLPAGRTSSAGDASSSDILHRPSPPLYGGNHILFARHGTARCVPATDPPLPPSPQAAEPLSSARHVVRRGMDDFGLFLMFERLGHKSHSEDVT